MKVLIIEDEQPAARQLTQLLQELDSGIRIVDVLDSIEASVAWFRGFPAPDAVFMDIQIADGISFDIFNQVEIKSPVIFTTAFDQYAIKAFRVNALDYLLKPIDDKELADVVDKVRQKNIAPRLDERILQDLLAGMVKKEYVQRLLVKSGSQLIPVDIADIAYFCSEDGLTQLFTCQGKKHYTDFTLDQLAEMLSPAQFFRINRKMILSVKCIQKISTHFNSRLLLQLSPDFKADVFVARERVGAFKEWLGGKY